MTQMECTLHRGRGRGRGRGRRDAALCSLVRTASATGTVALCLPILKPDDPNIVATGLSAELALRQATVDATQMIWSS